MRKFIFGTAAILTALSLQAGVDFDKDIKPILESRCVKCHGEKKQKGEYRLSNAKDIIYLIDDIDGVSRTETMISLEESINDKKRMMHAIFKEL